jgi:hypothetical protein
MAGVDLFANTATTTLAAALTDTIGTSVSVVSSTPFPAAVTGTSQFRIRIDSELMIVTNVSGTTWTVTRGAESSTAATHLISAAVTHILTAGSLTAMGQTSTPTAGGIGYGLGTTEAFTVAGTAGQALLSGGGSGPTWGATPIAWGVHYGASTSTEAYTAAASAANQVLTSVASAAPVWGPPPGQIVVAPMAIGTAGTTGVAGVETRDAVLGNYVFTSVAGHRYVVFLNGATITIGTAANSATLNIRDGGGSTPTASSTLVATNKVWVAATGGGGSVSCNVIGSFATATAATHTLSVFTMSTVVAIPSQQREIYVVDLGVSA